MTGDDGDVSRLRTGPWLPEPAVHQPPMPGRAEPPAPARAEPPAEPRSVSDPATAAAPVESPPPVPPHATVADGAGPAEPDRTASTTTTMEIAPVPGMDGQKPRRMWWGLAVAAALVAVIVVLVATCSGPAERPAQRAPEGNVVPTAGSAAAELAGTASGSPSPTATATPSRSPSPARSASREPFRTLELEAEATQLDGPAETVAYVGASGGRVVHRLGRQGPGAKKSGTLTFTVTAPEAGTYELTLYVALDGLDGSRTAVVSVAGGATTTVATSAGLACCTRATAQIRLAQGQNAITIGNPDDRAPAVDRIVVSAA